MAMEAAVTASARPTVGLAFSGGGFRATAFGLGALRALHDRDILPDVAVVSGISGGSLLAAMWAYGPADFKEFDTTVTSLLRRGLQFELLRRSLSPRRATANLTSVVGALLPGRFKRPRRSTRTETLVDALHDLHFGRKRMDEVTHSHLATVISATDLTTGNAVRLGSRASSCSPYGRINEPVRVAEAVAASAAFPALLPTLNRTYTFARSDGTQQTATIQMTDGGVYDNLGLSPLLPGRSPKFTDHVYKLDYLIAVDAGIGRNTRRTPRFMPARLKRTFEITHNKSQDGMRARIHELTTTGHLHGFIHAYLGMQDTRLPTPIPDLIPRAIAATYPTNFAAMSPESLDAITTRSEQLTRVLIEHYCPNLGR